MDVLDEVADLNRKLVVSQGDRVDGQPGKLVSQAGDGKEVLLDGDVEGILVLEVDGDCRIACKLWLCI